MELGSPELFNVRMNKNINGSMFSSASSESRRMDGANQTMTCTRTGQERAPAHRPGGPARTHTGGQRGRRGGVSTAEEPTVTTDWKQGLVKRNTDSPKFELTLILPTPAPQARSVQSSSSSNQGEVWIDNGLKVVENVRRLVSRRS